MQEAFAGGTVAVSITGRGRPLWLFHSLLADRDSFKAVLAPFAERFAVHLPALPGFDGSLAIAGGLPAVADRMAEAIRDRGGEAPLVLGNGYGGFVALQMAIRHPGLIAALVLADCGATFDAPGRAAFRAMAAGVAAGGPARIADIAMRRLFAPEFQDEHPALMDERRAAFLRTPPEVLISACGALADLDLRDAAVRVEIPTLVVVGERDEATPPRMSRELAALLPDARLVEIEGCAHVPQLQDPQRFLAAVLPFLEENGGR